MTAMTSGNNGKIDDKVQTFTILFLNLLERVTYK